MNKTCKNCVFLITEDGEPYYCAAQDLYAFINPNDEACDEFVSKQKDNGEQLRQPI